MEENPLISIIIPTYNRAHLIGETLDSIIAQTYPFWECIIVDDGSTDNTEEVVLSFVKKDSRFKFYKRPDSYKPGGNGARNFGFEMSKGEYINWFDSDDLMHPNKLEKQIIPLLNSNSNFSIANTTFFRDNITNLYGQTNVDIISTNIFEDFVLKKISIGTSQPLWKKSYLVSKNILYDERLTRGQDYDFHSNIFYEEKDLGIRIPDALTYYRVNNESITKNYHAKTKSNTIKLFLEIYKKNHTRVFRTNNFEAIDIHSEIYLNHILVALSKKKYKIVKNNLSFLKRHTSNEKKKYLFRVRLLCNILMLTNGKGYDFLKKTLIIR